MLHIRQLCVHKVGFWILNSDICLFCKPQITVHSLFLALQYIFLLVIQFSLQICNDIPSKSHSLFHNFSHYFGFISKFHLTSPITKFLLVSVSIFHFTSSSFRIPSHIIRCLSAIVGFQKFQNNISVIALSGSDYKNASWEGGSMCQVW